MTRSLGLLLLVLVVACGKPSPSEPEEHAGAAAAKAAAPGALCREHGVLEAVCTKCNPALIPVFKAKGDWCEEHGFPESFCPICHPERGGKPSAEVSADDAPADGTLVRFKTKETARLAGIEVVPIAARLSPARLSVTAKVVYDAAKVAQVSARSPGVIRSLHVDIGEAVRAGAALATIESASVGAEQARIVAARSRVQVAEANQQRVKQLEGEGIVAAKQLLSAQQELDTARAELAAARATLGVVGGVGDGARYTLSAPIAGVVTRRGATIGRLVDTEALLFEIVDTSSMWAEIDIPEAVVSRVPLGSDVELSVDSVGGRTFSGRLGYIAPEINPQTRMALGRVPLDNPDGLLRGNMFARGEVLVAAASPRLVVPRTAVQRARGVQLVFVRVAEDAFEARRVQLGAADDAVVEVSGRLQAGDSVATDGSFFLKTETLKGSIGAGCCEVEARP
jgi:cobalt-zinc-cadmium efflux system membrane fusion protein